MLSELVRLGLLSEVKIYIPNPSDAYDYLRMLLFQFINTLASIPPPLSRELRPEIPVFIRLLDSEVELAVQPSLNYPLLKIRTSRDFLKLIDGTSYIGVVLESTGTNLKMYRSRDEMVKDRERLLVVFRIFMNSGIEIHALPSIGRVEHGPII